jgi:hypothetical protein
MYLISTSPLLLSFFLISNALITDLASATENAQSDFLRASQGAPGRSGGGAEDLLNATTPQFRGPDDATQEGAMREGMQSIMLQNSLQAPIVPAYNSVTSLPANMFSTSAHQAYSR